METHLRKENCIGGVCRKIIESTLGAKHEMTILQEVTLSVRWFSLLFDIQ
jgi:hypothetical protein